jgi:hypothetical protein
MGNSVRDKETWMNRPVFVVAFFAVASAALVAQEASQSNPYQGVSNPPLDDNIISSEDAPPIAKPPAGHPMNAQPAAPAQTTSAPAPQPAVQSSKPVAVTRPANSAVTGTDDGTVQVAQPTSAPPDLASRPYKPDPDGDIVRPKPLGPGEIAEGTLIRVRLLNDLSSSFSEAGQPFHSRVATDVLQDGNVVIPTGSEISGKVVSVSTGRFAGHGSLLLHPDTVTLPNGESFQLHAMVSATPGSRTHVGPEGTVIPDRRTKRAAIEYAGGVGAGALTGALLGGPVGALAGGAVGAGLVTTHLLVSHAQANLDNGSVLMLTLTTQVHLVPTTVHGE